MIQTCSAQKLHGLGYRMGPKYERVKEKKLKQKPDMLKTILKSQEFMKLVR